MDLSAEPAREQEQGKRGKKRSPPRSKAPTRAAEDDIDPDDTVSDTEEYECKLPRTKTAAEISLHNTYSWKNEQGEWEDHEGYWQQEGCWWRKTGEKQDRRGLWKAKWRKVNVYKWKGWMDFRGFPTPSGNSLFAKDCHACRERRIRDIEREKQEQILREEQSQIIESIQSGIKKLTHEDKEP